MSTQLTIRNVPPRLAKQLKLLSAEKGESVNTFVLRLLEQALGIDARQEQLKRFQTWTEEDVREMDAVLKDLRRIDPEDWK